MDTSFQFLGKTILDLTLTLEAGKQSWNIHPPVTLIPYHQSQMNRYRNGQLCPGFDTKLMMMTDHTGTHVDAQSHFYPEGKCMLGMPLSSLIGGALFLDVSRPVTGKPIRVNDIRAQLEKQNQTVKQGDILLLKCWHEAWGVGDNFDSADALAGEVADWILDNGIKLLGTDIPTVDDLSNPHKDIHVKLLQENIPIIENLINLEQISVSRFDFMALPLKLKGATGSPVRALAFL